MKKYPEYNEEQSKQFEALFLELRGNDFFFNIFTKFYHKGYGLFSTKEEVFSEVIELLNSKLPSVPFDTKQEGLWLEIDIKC